MAKFTDSEQLYTCMRLLFAQIETENPQAVEVVLKSKLAIRFNCSIPTAQVTIDARKRPFSILYGSSSITPDLDIALPTDALHRILLGELTLTKALGSGQLKPTGPVWKTAVLADLFYHAQKIYPQILQQQGIK